MRPLPQGRRSRLGGPLRARALPILREMLQPDRSPSGGEGRKGGEPWPSVSVTISPTCSAPSALNAGNSLSRHRAATWPALRATASCITTPRKTRRTSRAAVVSVSLTPYRESDVNEQRLQTMYRDLYD